MMRLGNRGEWLIRRNGGTTPSRTQVPSTGIQKEGKHPWHNESVMRVLLSVAPPTANDISDNAGDGDGDGQSDSDSDCEHTAGTPTPSNADTKTKANRDQGPHQQRTHT